jgi:acetyl esterase/lipase
MTTFRLGRRGLIAAAGSAALTRGAAAQAGAPPLIPRRLLFDAPQRTWATISPDGKRLAFLAPVDGVQNVWLAPLHDLDAAKPLTRVTDRDVMNKLVWPHDNRHVVFFREQGGDENWQAHRIDVESGDIRPLTPGPGVRSFLQQHSAQFPGELLLSHNARDKRFYDVYRVNVATAESTLLLQNDQYAWIFTDPRFRARWGIRYGADGGFDMINIDGPEAGRLFRSFGPEDAMTTEPVEVSADGNTLFWRYSQGQDRSELMAQDLVNGRADVLASSLEADVGEPVLDPVSCRPIAVPVVYERRRWLAIDPSAVADLDLIKSAGQGELGWFGTSDDRKTWVAFVEPRAAAGRYLHYDRPTGTVRRLFSTRPALDDAPLVPMEPVVVTARDGLKLVCYLSRPRESAGRPGPMVLLVHGGPWARDMPDFSSTHQWLANRGYAVLSVNYRGSTGFGKEFVNAGDLEWANRMHADLLDAVDWAVGERIASPTRVAIYGASYGGYSALVGATFTPTRFACAIDLFGISNLVTFARDIPPYWKTWESVLKTRMGDVSTEEGRKFLEARSPLTYVDRIVRPLLIGQGGNDVRVTATESEQIVAAMQKRKIPVTYVFYKDEGHGFRRAANRRSWSAVVEAFLAQHLGGRAEPVGEDFAGSTVDFRAGRVLVKGLG